MEMNFDEQFSRSVGRHPLERDPFVDAMHVRDGIHNPYPLAREIPRIDREPVVTQTRTLELGAVGLDASTSSRES